MNPFRVMTVFLLCCPFRAEAEILIFGDLSGFAREPRQEDSSFPRSELDPHAALFYSGAVDRFTALMEFVSSEKGGRFERLKAGFYLGDGSALWLGRFHNPAGYWRDQYHHGSYLQPTVTTPGVARFERQNGILPAHTTGVQLEGEKLLAGHSFGYALGLGYGGRLGERGLDSPDFMEEGRERHNVTVAGRLSWQPDALEENVLGVFFSNNHVDSEVGGGEEIEQWLAGGFANWEFGRLTLSSELYFVRNQPYLGTGAGWDRFSTGYLQVIYSFNRRVSMYSRAENTIGFRGDFYLDYFPAFVNQQQLVGSRYELTANQALKLELGRERRQSGEVYRYLALQWSVVVP